MSAIRPLETLEGVGKRLELYPDHLVIRRTDFLATVLPVGFEDSQSARYEAISHVDLYEPGVWRLDEPENINLQLIVTRRDHSTFSLTFSPQQRQAAQAMRAHIQVLIKEAIHNGQDEAEAPVS